MLTNGSSFWIPSVYLQLRSPRSTSSASAEIVNVYFHDVHIYFYFDKYVNNYMRVALYFVP